MKKIAIALALAYLLLLMGCAATVGEGNPEFVEKARGQTIETEAGKLRLKGIYMPAFEQVWGKECRYYLREMLENTTALVDAEDEVDSYGRRWGYVWLNGKLVNAEIAKAGCALADTKPDKHTLEINRAETYARTMEKKIWSPNRPLRVHPKEFKKGKYER